MAKPLAMSKFDTNAVTLDVPALRAACATVEAVGATVAHEETSEAAAYLLQSFGSGESEGKASEWLTGSIRAKSSPSPADSETKNSEWLTGSIRAKAGLNAGEGEAKNNDWLTGSMRAKAGQSSDVPVSMTQVEAVRAQNAKLRSRIEELEKSLDDVMREDAPDFAKRLEEFEQSLREKDQHIEELSQELTAAQRAAAQAVAPVTSTSEQDLLAQREEIAQARAHLEEDERHCMEQMRNMELEMSRERAEIARQRVELTRLQQDIRQELESAGRDTKVRDRLAPLQRQYQEVIKRRGAAQASASKGASRPEPTLSREDSEVDTKPLKEAGLFRRIFGK